MRKTLRFVGLCAWMLLWLAPAARGEEGAAAAGDAQPSDPPPRQPVTSIQGSAPSESLEERMARFKREKGAGSDKPFEGFAAQAEAEMQRQRAEAIATTPQQVEELEAEAAVESRVGARERLQDKLAALGAWGGSGCVEIEPAWSAQSDFIRHRKLRASDFLSRRDMSAAAVSVTGAPPLGFAAIAFSCEVGAEVQQASEGSYIARVTRVRYYAVMSRKDSWLAEHAENRDAFLVGHQQLHFDMAEEFAKWLNSHRDGPIARMQGVGRTPQLALGQLQLQWAQHMLSVHDDFDTLETAFDRDTKHGRATEKQTEWAFKLGDGFDALTSGMKLETRGKPKRR